MSFHGYNNDADEYIDLDNMEVGEMDLEDAVVTFNTDGCKSGQFKIEFNLDLVRTHLTDDGTVYVTLK